MLVVTTRICDRKHRENGKRVFKKKHLHKTGLTITAYKGEEAELSGGLPLSSLQWTPSSANPKIHTTKVPKALLSGAAIRALHINGVRATLARYPNSNPELDLFPDGYIANKTVSGYCRTARTREHERAQAHKCEPLASVLNDTLPFLFLPFYLFPISVDVVFARNG